MSHSSAPTMKTKLFLLIYLLLPLFAQAQTPSLVSYQGRVVVGTTNFEGNGNFRFALVNAAGTTFHWSNAPDVSPANGIPDAAVNLSVTKGLYSVLLGDTSLTNMAAIPASVWANADVRLRVWFNDGVNGNQLLTPDQRLSPNGYLADGTVSSAKMAAGAVTSAQLADGAVISAKLANNLALGGTTTGTFSGPLTGNVTGNVSGSAANFTGTLAGDVAGTQGTTTVATVGGVSAASIATGAGLANAATSANTPGALVKRDASGNFSVGTITGTFSGNGSGLTSLNGGNIITASITSAKLASNLSLGGTTTGTFSGNLSGNAATATSASNFTGTLVGDVTGTQGATVIANAVVTAAKLGTDVGLWSVAGSHVFRNAGNVGIGTTSPGRNLQVTGGNGAGIRVTGGGGQGSSVSLDLSNYDPVASGGSTPGAQVLVTDAGGWTGNMDFMTKTHGALANPLVSRLHIHHSGNVGIGTITPETVFQIGDYANTFDNHLTIATAGGNQHRAGLRLRHSNGLSGFTIESDERTSSKGLNFLDHLNDASGTSRLFLQSNTGNIGIGTTIPSAPLQIIARAGSAPDTNGLDVFNPSNTTNSNAILSARVAGTAAGNPIVSLNVVGESGWIVGLDNADANKFKIASTTVFGGTPRMTVTTDGNVGIGTETPGSKFEISNGTTSLKVMLGQLNAASSSGDVTLDIPGDHTLGIWDSLSVDDNLTVVGNSNIVGRASIGAGAVSATVALKVKKATSSHAVALFENETGADVVFIGTPTHSLFVDTSTGLTQRSDDSPFWSVTSDRRLKTGIVPLTSALDIVAQLHPVRYHYTAEHLAKMPGSVDKEHYGIIAQEYQKIFPQFVTTGKDGYLSVQSDPLIFVATAAIKELHAALAAKDAEIAALKKKLADNAARDKALEDRLTALELRSPAATAQPVKVALKK
jgi:hypothetical protein